MIKNIVIAASFISVATAAFTGEGTFYGAGGAGSSGACMLQPGMSGVGVTVAINPKQFDKGVACGKCIRLTGAGQSVGAAPAPVIGPIFAVVDNVCTDCKSGDLDLGLPGDGRWRVTWDFVDCAAASKAASSLPSRTGNRSLRGGQAEPITLAPGYMVTKEGIRLIADVLAEQTPVEAAIAAEPEAKAQSVEAGAN